MINAKNRNILNTCWHTYPYINWDICVDGDKDDENDDNIHRSVMQICETRLFFRHNFRIRWFYRQSNDSISFFCHLSSEFDMSIGKPNCKSQNYDKIESFYSIWKCVFLFGFFSFTWIIILAWTSLKNIFQLSHPNILKAKKMIRRHWILSIDQTVYCIASHSDHLSILNDLVFIIVVIYNTENRPGSLLLLFSFFSLLSFILYFPFSIDGPNKMVKHLAKTLIFQFGPSQSWTQQSDSTQSHTLCWFFEQFKENISQFCLQSILIA